MSNATKKPTGWNADEVLQEMRDWDHAEDWPSDVSTLTRWADVFADLIVERDALRETVGLFADDADRYRWLKERSLSGSLGFDAPDFWLSAEDSDGWDAAIDAALANEST